LRLEHYSAEQVIAELSGAQIIAGHIEGDGGLHLRFADGRVFVVIGLPALGVAMLQPEGRLH